MDANPRSAILTTMCDTKRLAKLDHQHVWHPFTPMRQWRDQPPLIIDRAEGFHLIDTQGKRYIDGVSSLWCNVHGHQVPQIDQAIRNQLNKVAHTTLLGLASPPSIQFAAMLCDTVNRSLHPPSSIPHPPSLTKVFYSDAGATAVEVAFKMAVGYWHHTGKPQKNKFIGLAGAYHGDTTGSMSVGFSELFHKPFVSMAFDVKTFPHIDPLRSPSFTGSSQKSVWPSEHDALNQTLMNDVLKELDNLLTTQAHQTAAIVIEPVMQGAAGMICQPPGFVKAVHDLAKKHNVLLIADEVATGFGRTGKFLACAHDQVTPDILCLAKGITGGYLPLAATITNDKIEQAFTGTPDEHPPKTLYHGHTYTGNPLACAAAIASLKLFQENNVLTHANQSTQLIKDKLAPLHDHPFVIDIRQRGLMVGIELGKERDIDSGADSLDFARRAGATLCKAMLPQGLIIRPLGNTLVLMPAPAMDHETLNEMLDIIVKTVQDYSSP
jgi:adenosylmethionine---8-amino-7-oxononanoate aminotransferase